MSEEQSNRTETPLIRISNFSFRYFDSNSNVLNDLNLDIHSGEIVLIAGKSGCGKSTLLRAINGLIPHQHSGEYVGQVTVDGIHVASSKMSVLATRVGYIFQNPENQIFMFSVERDIAFGLENLSKPSSEIRTKVNWALEVLEIQDIALRAPHELSDGQKQKVAIAGSIVMGQKILILDEPTALLDPYTATSVIQLIKRLHDDLGITILIVEHRLDLVSKIATRLLVIDKGKIIFDGHPRDILYSTNLALYGVNEPTIIRLSKLLSSENEISPNSNPMSSDELASEIRGSSSNGSDRQSGTR